jgi:hypothetical protein
MISCAMVSTYFGGVIRPAFAGTETMPRLMTQLGIPPTPLLANSNDLSALIKDLWWPEHAR